MAPSFMRSESQGSNRILCDPSSRAESHPPPDPQIACRAAQVPAGFVQVSPTLSDRPADFPAVIRPADLLQCVARKAWGPRRPNSPRRGCSHLFPRPAPRALSAGSGNAFEAQGCVALSPALRRLPSLTFLGMRRASRLQPSTGREMKARMPRPVPLCLTPFFWSSTAPLPSQQKRPARK